MRLLESSWNITAPIPTSFATSSMSRSEFWFFSAMISLVFSTALFNTSSRNTTLPCLVDMVPSSRLTRPKGTCELQNLEPLLEVKVLLGSHDVYIFIEIVGFFSVHRCRNVAGDVKGGAV